MGRLRRYRNKLKDVTLGKTNLTNTLVLQHEDLHDARKGALYFISNIEMKKVESFSNSHFFGDMVLGSDILSDMKSASAKILKKADTNAIMQQSKIGRKVQSLTESNAATKVKNIAGAAADLGAAVIQKIKDIISGFFRMLVNKAGAVYGETLQTAEWFSQLGSFLTAEFALNFANVIPGWGYVQGVNDIYAGLKQAVFKSSDFMNQVYLGRGVDLLGGTPSIIAKSLLRHSAAGALCGLKDMAAGVTSIALEAAGDAFAGIGTLVNIVKGIFDKIVQLVDFMIQRHLVKKSISRAKKEWGNYKAGSSGLIDNHDLFSKWFRTISVTTPIIPSLVMSSGFVAHPQKFLNLLGSGSDYLAQEKYAQGVIYIEQLKKLACKHVREYVDNYNVQFCSDDTYVKLRLKEITSGKGIRDGEEVEISDKTSYTDSYKKKLTLLKLKNRLKFRASSA